MVSCSDSTEATAPLVRPSPDDPSPDDPEPDDPTVPLAPALSVTVQEAVAPGTVELLWSSSEGATNCEASSAPSREAWQGAVGTGADQTTTLVDLEAGTYELSLSCSNAAGSSAPATVSAMIGAAAPCANRQPPLGWARLGADQGTQSCYYEVGPGFIFRDCTVWNGGISDVPFIDEIGLSHRLAFAGRPDPQQYLAIEIDTTGLDPSAGGRVTTVSDGFADSPASIVTISSCPGDFHESAVLAETGCYGAITALGPTFFWGGVDSGESCQLESGQTYYLNIIPTSSPLGTEPDALSPHPNCDGGPCGRVTQLQ